MEDTLVLRRKLKTASLLLVISSKMRDIFSSNVILIKQKEKTYSQNWHTQHQMSFIWLTKKNSFSLCATKTKKYLHGLANSYINISKIELNTYHRYNAVCIFITLPEGILGVYQFSCVDACIPLQYKCIDTNEWYFTEFYTIEILRHAISLIVLCIPF